MVMKFLRAAFCALQAGAASQAERCGIRQVVPGTGGFRMRPMTTLSLIAALTLVSAPALGQSASATATLNDAEGTAIGTITVTDMDGGVHLMGDLTGVPNGEHGFHLHETGVCDATAKFESAGGHFNPDAHQHGKENPAGPHDGDLDNVTADDDGNTVVDLHNANATIADLNDEDGAAIVLHADADDYTTDPSGNSGDRIACGVLEFAE
jgi:Cu-Zn family superoxide dismutase